MFANMRSCRSPRTSTTAEGYFHRVVPAEKSFEIQMGSGKALAAYREEARKCVLVCANCHGEIEAGLIPSPPAGSKLDV